MNPDPKNIIGAKYAQNLVFLGNILADRLLLGATPPEGIEVNELDQRSTSSYNTDLTTKKPCFYQTCCPKRTESAGFFEVVQTDRNENISRFFLHMACAKDLAYRVALGENP